MGILYGVSVGPGDPELLTLKALRIIRGCDVIAAPDNNTALSIVERVCDIGEKMLLKPAFPMTRDRELLKNSHIAAADELCRYLDNGENIAFICLGDISVYSTFSYISELVSARGHSVEMIPGVTSFCAAAAELKQPLALGSEPLLIIPSGSREFDLLLSVEGTKVIMKSGSAIPELKEKLRGKTVYAVENCGFENQKLYYSVDELENCGYFTTVIIKDSVTTND